MIPADVFCGVLGSAGVRHYTGVPCSQFGEITHYVETTDGLHYVPAANEGVALAIAAGAALGGEICPVLIQSSGFGNLFNPLTSLLTPYRIPGLIFISNRADPSVSTIDEPQHVLVGRTLRPVLATLGIPTFELPDDADDFAALVSEVLRRCWRKGQVAALIAPFRGRSGAMLGIPAGPHTEPRPTKQAAIEAILAALAPGDAVVSTTGTISRTLFLCCERRLNFYMQGSMGHARAIALGLASTAPHRRIVVLDGDGAALMHLGSLADVGAERPSNLLDVILDNESYGSTGGQPTRAVTTDLGAVAQACGYPSIFTCSGAAGLPAVAAQASSRSPGPVLLWVKVRDAPISLPRITGKYTQPKIARRFRRAVGSTVNPRQPGASHEL